MSGNQNNPSHKTEEELKKDFDDLVQGVTETNSNLDENGQESAEYTIQTEIAYHLSDQTWYGIFIYPLHTLATNRILDTVISRKPGKRSMVTDYRDMWRIGGRNVVFAGYVPYFLVSALYTGQIIVKSY